MLVKYSKKIYLSVILIVIAVFGCLLVFLNSLPMTAKAKVLNTFPLLYRASELTKFFDFFYLPMTIGESKTEKWNLIIKQKNLDQLDSSLPKDFLHEQPGSGFKDEVKAKLYIGNEEYDVNVRYRGATPSHWAWAKKSWSINFDKDKSYKGIDKINLIEPKDRHFFIEALNNYRAKKLGLVVPHYDFINLSINGQNQSFYYLSEQLSATMLAKNNKPDSSNIYGDSTEDNYLYQDPAVWKKLSGGETDDRSDLSAYLTFFQNKDRDSLLNLTSRNNLISWSALNLLAGSRHQNNGNNVKIFFNNSVGRFEWIPDDVALFELTGDINQTDNDLIDYIFTDNSLRQQRDDLLKNYLNNEDNLKDDLNYLAGLYKQYKADVYSDNFKRYGNVMFSLEYWNYRDMLEDNVEKLKEILTKTTYEKETVQGPVASLDDKYVKNNQILNHFFEITDVEKFKNQNKMFLVNEKNKEIILPAGLYSFYSTVVIPKGFTLKINAGVTVLMSPGVSLVSYSRVIAEGSISAPIAFKRLNSLKPWGSFAVLVEGGANSLFDYCDFSGGKDDTINGAFVSGMLNIYSSGAEIKNCSFSNATGDDSLNIKNGYGYLENNIFKNNISDAIDFDWGTGAVLSNKFYGNGNDAIDLGGCNGVLVKDNLVFNSGDKCVSIGEESLNIKLFNNLFSHCNIGVAVKDKSVAQAANNIFCANKTGIAAYMKKDIFGGSEFEVYNSIIWGGEKMVDIDELSKVKILYSDVAGGYSGKGNITTDPKLDVSCHVLSTDSNFSTGGEVKYLENFDILKVDKTPIGLFNPAIY
ncbi:MAG: hypothetical protein US42_C0004G0032 [Candidatus Magasanikbacteria bacterium GW2011_GWC2_37_14]|uniref:Right handed beta helix domain-containing protein n=1 Tax=Candidatus Magasanikbacteria bacterium GW2011_GWC2_37_14 TaxID=1619046 RepID=A0A0G0G9V3_9BACT|nr:MAG: hypothetical protein US42_C0004G0032 [Candidatus Magasanikbacteria bacterium GW2011_GWC2_37_14]